jgi:uncharacterized protein (DUF2147 family)
MRLLLVLILSLFSTISMAENTVNESSPIGYWKTVDDVTGRVRSVVQIYETPNHELSGKIVKTFPTPGVAPITSCSKCDGERHDQPMIGLVIMEKLKLAEDKSEWKGGEIIDPTTGKIYKCMIKAIDNNQKLHVRGYIGLPLLGRSQTWLRTEV